MAENGALKSLSVLSIDRIGQDIRDLINIIYYFNEKKIPIKFLSQDLTTLDGGGKENPISKMIISILGIVAEMERNQIRERQLEGIKLAMMRGAYKGRVAGNKEDVLTFLSKDKIKKR